MHIKYEKLINLNEIKKLEANFLLLYRIMYKNILNISEINKYELKILLKDKFKSERGRINCSLWEEGGRWRWLGIQYVIAEY